MERVYPDDKGIVLAHYGPSDVAPTFQMSVFVPKETVADPFLVESAAALERLVWNIYQLRRQVFTSDAAQHWRSVYRIDDRRPGRWRCYMITLQPRGRCNLEPRTIYHHYGYGANEGPVLTNFNDVAKLVFDEDSLTVTDLGDDVGKDVRSPDMQERWGFEGRVTVYDLGEIYRNLAGRPAAEQAASLAVA